ncbi:hypothetical protein ACFQ14_08210 [Pseudahrensia aquimaris]|uniref:Lipoprotein n=1 Tax=Pseudahrensia aquimaris TaxID=744461 RepID=A0ABW3FD25_9HYPH
MKHLTIAGPLAALALAGTLASCTTDNTLSPARAPASQAQTGAPATTPTGQPIVVRIGSLAGPPAGKTDDLRETLEATAPQQGIEVVKDQRKTPQYVLSAQLNALPQGDTTIVSHVWTVSDLQGATLHQFTLSETQEGSSNFAWGGVNKETLTRIAESALSAFAVWNGSR